MRINGGNCVINGYCPRADALGVGLFDGRVFVERVEHQLDDVRPIEAVAKTRGGKEVGAWFQPRLTCQPIRSSPPGEAI